jgi:hypothetical protein
MNAFAASFIDLTAALPASAVVAATGLNNNANNNTRHHGWAGV